MSVEQAHGQAELSEVLQRARALVFDFDGTLVNSNEIKWRAFERCFAEFPEHREQIGAYCRAHHHAPRWEKFRHVYERMLELPYTPVIEAALHARFDDATTEQIIQAPEIPGATQFLAASVRRYTTALLSNTPHDTLLQIVSRRGWQRFFSIIQGAPNNKTVWLKRFQAQQSLRDDEVVYFGDTQEDAEAAQQAGCIFVGVANETLSTASGHFIVDFLAV